VDGFFPPLARGYASLVSWRRGSTRETGNCLFGEGEGMGVQGCLCAVTHDAAAAAAADANSPTQTLVSFLHGQVINQGVNSQ
jgi:hypothetical protein